MAEMETTPFGATHHVWTDDATGEERVAEPIYRDVVLHFEDDQKCGYCGAPSIALQRMPFTTWDVLVCAEHVALAEQADAAQELWRAEK